MYLLGEDSLSSEDPLFLRLPSPKSNADYKEKQIMFFPEYSVAKWFFEKGIAEKALIHWITDNFIDSGKMFLDIGAHVGTYAWTCGKKALHTYAFEFSPTTFCYLAANIALQNMEEKISPLPFALGNKEGIMDYIIRSKDGGGNGCKHLSATDNNCRKIPIPVRTLDSFQLDNVGFIKIDVEGFEKEVLEGAVETLKRNNYPKIVFESWGDWKESEGVPAKQLRLDVIAFLESLGYRVDQIGGCQDMFLAAHKGS